MRSPAPTQDYVHDFYSLLDENEVLSTFMLCLPSTDYALAHMRVNVGVCNRLFALLSQAVSGYLSDPRQKNTELDDAFRSLSVLLFMSPSIIHNNSIGSFINVSADF